MQVRQVHVVYAYMSQGLCLNIVNTRKICSPKFSIKKFCLILHVDMLYACRHQRYKIIRTIEEYIFIHECILDHVTCMNRIDVMPRNLADFIRRSKEVNQDGW